jgi:hypothetical protein
MQEPTVEAGDRIWRVATSCVQMYKAGRQCSDADVGMFHHDAMFIESYLKNRLDSNQTLQKFRKLNLSHLGLSRQA